MLFPADVLGEGESLRILSVGLMAHGFGELPDSGVNGREEGIRIGPRMVDMRDVQFVGQGQKLPIDHSAPDDEILLAGIGHTQGLVNAISRFRPFEGLTGDVSKDDVAPVGQRVTRQREEGALSHDDGASGCNLLEMLQVVRQMTEQVALAAYLVLFGDSYYYGNHTLTIPAICG